MELSGLENGDNLFAYILSMHYLLLVFWVVRGESLASAARWAYSMVANVRYSVVNIELRLSLGSF
jgi:hypothetical protein